MASHSPVEGTEAGLQSAAAAWKAERRSRPPCGGSVALPTPRSCLRQSGANGVVQSAARCVLSHLPPVVFAANVDPSSIRLTYICGNKFLIENVSDTRVLLEYVVVGTTERFKQSIPAGKSQFLHTIETGTMRLSHNGSLLTSKENEGRPCPDDP